MAGFLKNFGFASEGIRYFFKSERNGRLQAAITLLVIFAGFIVGLTRLEWCIILICIAMVLGLEMINTALERVCEMLSKDYHPIIKIIKDVAAGAVLWASVIAALIGLIIFFPHIF